MCGRCHKPDLLREGLAREQKRQIAAGYIPEEARIPRTYPAPPRKRRRPADEKYLTAVQEQLDAVLFNTAIIRRHLALLYDHHHQPADHAPLADQELPADAYRRLASARREYAHLLDMMADYQDTEGYRNDATARRQVAAHEYALAAHAQAKAEEQTRQTGPPEPR